MKIKSKSILLKMIVPGYSLRWLLLAITISISCVTKDQFSFLQDMMWSVSSRQTFTWIGYMSNQEFSNLTSTLLQIKEIMMKKFSSKKSQSSEITKTTMMKSSFTSALPRTCGSVSSASISRRTLRSLREWKSCFSSTSWHSLTSLTIMLANQTTQSYHSTMSLTLLIRQTY